MKFGLFVPSRFSSNVTTTTTTDDASEKKTTKENVPAIYWLSGLTRDDTNFAMKAIPRAFLAAEKEGIAIVMPDTSPRR